jgi:hypothetical protein
MAAERALYVAQRLPFMLRWQGELWSVKVADMPETKQLLTNTAQLTDAVAQLSSVADQLPNRFTKEGQRIIETLQSEQTNLLGLSTEMRSTLNAGSQMASNTLLTLNCFDEVMQRLQQYNLDSDGELFHIRNYTEAAAQLDVAALHLSGLLNELDKTLASTNLHGLVNEVAPVVEDVESSGRELVDHAFKMLLLLLVIACALFLVTAALHRRMARGPGSTPQA